MNAIADPQAHYAQLLESRQRETAGREPNWLTELRTQARDAFVDRGFPDRRDEAWRYTALGPLLKTPFAASSAVHALQHSDLEEHLIPALDAWRLVLVNGRVVPALSDVDGLPASVTVGSLTTHLLEGEDWLATLLNRSEEDEESIFSALNLAGMQDGAVIRVGAGQKLARPIELLHVAVGMDSASVTQARHAIVLEPRAEATVIERYVALGDSLYFNNVVTHVSLADESRLLHYRLQEESSLAFHLQSQYLQQAAGSHYEGVGLALGGAWSRTDTNVDLRGERAQCHLKGLYIVGDGQLVDNHLDVRHNVPACASTEDFRGVLNGSGRGVFDGRILVARDAQKTDAHLTNKNLLLSRSAEVDTKPQLEIYADDVACSHGTTVGQIEADTLFYLRSRGIPEGQAQRMICLGFSRAVFEDCPVAPLADYLEHRVARRLAFEVA